MAYIDRDKLQEHFKNAVSAHEADINGYAYPVYLCDHVMHEIRNAPAADVAEVKHGEWKPKHYEGGFMDGTNFEECSICRYRRYFDDIRFKLTFDYCPKCGAKMDGKEGVKSDL